MLTLASWVIYRVVRVEEYLMPLSRQVSWMRVLVSYASVEGENLRQFESGVMLSPKFVILFPFLTAFC